jgi:hypothetical protein
MHFTAYAKGKPFRNEIAPFGSYLCYIIEMFQIVKQIAGNHGSFIRLVRLDSDDYAVIVRVADDGRLNHLYIGPDSSKAEEIFNQESSRMDGQTPE